MPLFADDQEMTDQEIMDEETVDGEDDSTAGSMEVAQEEILRQQTLSVAISQAIPNFKGMPISHNVFSRRVVKKDNGNYTIGDWHQPSYSSPKYKLQPRSEMANRITTEMLHEPDPHYTQFAHEICGKATVYNDEGGVRLYCRRRDCPYCYRRRYQKIALLIRKYIERMEEQGVEVQFHWQKIPSSEHAHFCRDIRNRHGEYLCFPVKDKDDNRWEYVAATNITGKPLHLGESRLESTLAVWCVTPRGRKISCSNGIKIPDNKPKKKKLTSYFAHTSLEKVVPHVEQIGGKILHLNRSYAKWEVNAEQLTDHLNQNNIYAYQLTLDDTQDILNGDLREAEQELGMAPGTLTREDWDKVLAVRDKLLGNPGPASSGTKAVPVDRHGRKVALPVNLESVKLGQVLSNSYATVSPNTLPEDVSHYGKSAPPS